MCLRTGLRCIIVSVPSGAVGVVSKEDIAYIVYSAEIWGLRVHGRIIFKVMSHCSIILHKFSMQKEGGDPDLKDVK